MKLLLKLSPKLFKPISQKKCLLLYIFGKIVMLLFSLSSVRDWTVWRVLKCLVKSRKCEAQWLCCGCWWAPCESRLMEKSSSVLLKDEFTCSKQLECPLTPFMKVPGKLISSSSGISGPFRSIIRVNSSWLLMLIPRKHRPQRWPCLDSKNKCIKTLLI